MAVCGQCGGNGYVAEGEYDQLSMSNAHACYHCGTTGECKEDCCQDYDGSLTDEEIQEIHGDKDEYGFEGYIPDFPADYDPNDEPADWDY